MEKNKLKAVIFDLDGVITDSAKYHFQAWKRLADELGIDFDEEYNEKLKGVSRLESLELILANGTTDSEYTLAEKMAMADRKNEHYKELIKQITPAELLPGIQDFLNELKENQIKIALASVSKNAQFILKQLKLEQDFDYVADAEAITRAKPFPDLFLAGMNEFSYQPEECIGIEDAKTGIEAIHRAGMKAIGVGTPEQMEEAEMILQTSELKLQDVKEKLGFL